MESTEFSQTKSSLLPRLQEELEDLANRDLRRRILTPDSGQKEKIVLEGATLLNITSILYNTYQCLSSGISHFSPHS